MKLVLEKAPDVHELEVLLELANEYRCTARPIEGAIHAGKWLACIDWRAEFQFDNEEYESYVPKYHDRLVFDTFLQALEFAVQESQRIYFSDQETRD